MTKVIILCAVLLGVVVVDCQTQNRQQTGQLLSYEQQQELLNQLAQLQRQTQQLLAAQQSLAAVAAAAANSGSSPQTPTTQIVSSSPQQHQSAPIRTRQPSASTTSRQTTNKPSSTGTSSLSNSDTHRVTKPKQQVNVETTTTTAQPPLPQGPQINWGKCPELEPSEQEKLAKAGVITKCLESTPLPGNITRESVEQHREQIAACALRAEGWFTSAGGYDFSKAEKEIKNKHLTKDLENQVLSYHSQCKTESEEKYPITSSSIIAQIQLYQACMDYFISDVCGIEVNETDSATPVWMPPNL